jgi:muramoyltetrapeptide carboxypeptidase
MTKTPPYLKKGDTIAITCPAGYMPREKAQTCIETIQQWGFEVMVGKTLGSKSKNYFSGNDETRLNELQAMLDDEGIKAILCGRGGYGISRIIDQIDFTRFKKNPKWIIGFSDITLLHAHIHRNFKIATLHAPMAAAFNNGENKNEFIDSLHKALVGKKAKYACKADAFNKLGEAKGELIGGNLTLITHLIGTKSDINTKNKILFIEDIGELIYSTDRMLHQLKRSGKLTNLSGLIVGGFTDVKDTERPFGKKVKEMIKDILQNYDYPVCFDFPVGHKKENYALKIGGDFQLKITNTKVLLSEL